MKIGLYFGTFNPIHVGHLIIANHLVEHSDLDQVWMVVTPHNPFKQKSTLLDNFTRFHLVELATQHYPKIRPSNIEFNLPQPNYTITTLVHLEEKYPQHQFRLIMGEDNLNGLHKWKNFEQILENYPIYVYPRISDSAEKSAPIPLQNHANVHWVKAPILEISSTAIRRDIKARKNVRPLLAQEVWQYIDHNLLYS